MITSFDSPCRGDAPIEVTTAVERHAIPTTVSAEAAAGLATIFSLISQRPAPVRPQTTEDFDAAAAQLNEFYGPLVKAIADRLGVSTMKDQLGGVPILRIRPADWQPTGRTLVYLHGGGYTLFSAATSLSVPAQLAAQSGDEIISIDYTLAPRGTWRTVVDEVLSVWRALLGTGVPAETLGMVGDSAGGGLAAGSILAMRDQRLPLPGALYLLSPWSDITPTGDTCSTLAAADPTLDSKSLAWAAAAYADPDDQSHPYVSPVHGDYSQPFPPTLIQVGTREIFLSHAVRLYQALRSCGREAILDVYEGMPHVHQALLPGVPETVIAIGRATDFFASKLRLAAAQ